MTLGKDYRFRLDNAIRTSTERLLMSGIKVHGKDTQIIAMHAVVLVSLDNCNDIDELGR